MKEGTHQEPMIQVRGIDKTYTRQGRSITVLSGIDLEVQKGDFLAITGPSGAGKSTLLYILGCLDRPTTGTYSFNTVETTSIPDRELSMIRSRLIGFVFQTFNLVPSLNVHENVKLPFFYQREFGASVTKKADSAIERVGLAHRKNHLPDELSGGEMQRVAIARAVACRPSLILADEPTGNLDTETGKEVLTLFSELNQEGVTIIMVTHDIHAAKTARQVISMQDGKICTG